MAKIEAGYSKGPYKVMGQGKFRNTVFVSHGGLRIYFAHDGNDIVIPLGGGNKYNNLPI